MPDRALRDPQTEDLNNLADYLMRADASRLAQFARALAMEFAVRGLDCDEVMFDIARKLERIRSSPRSSPLVTR